MVGGVCVGGGGGRRGAGRAGSAIDVVPVILGGESRAWDDLYTTTGAWLKYHLLVGVVGH